MPDKTSRTSMGGAGSGTWYRWDKKSRVEEHLKLDVRSLKREKLLHDGSSFVWLWEIDDKSSASIKVQVEENRLFLCYRYRCNARDEFLNVEESVWITWKTCNYGGKRPYFLCPSCDRRVAILYLAGKYFLCRNCHKLTYSSQSESRVDRIFRRVRKIRKRLGASMDLTQPILLKPKGMHQRTFDKLRYQADQDLTRAFEYLSHQMYHRMSKRG